MTTFTSTFLAFMALVSPIVQGASALRLPFAKRDTTSLPALATLDMPLTFDSQGRYTLPVRMVSSPSRPKHPYILNVRSVINSTSKLHLHTVHGDRSYLRCWLWLQRLLEYPSVRLLVSRVSQCIR